MLSGMLHLRTWNSRRLPCRERASHSLDDHDPLHKAVENDSTNLSRSMSLDLGTLRKNWQLVRKLRLSAPRYRTLGERVQRRTAWRQTLKSRLSMRRRVHGSPCSTLPLRCRPPWRHRCSRNGPTTTTLVFPFSILSDCPGQDWRGHQHIADISGSFGANADGSGGQNVSPSSFFRRFYLSRSMKRHVPVLLHSHFQHAFSQQSHVDSLLAVLRARRVKSLRGASAICVCYLVVCGVCVCVSDVVGHNTTVDYRKMLARLQYKSHVDMSVSLSLSCVVLCCVCFGCVYMCSGCSV